MSSVSTGPSVTISLDDLAGHPGSTIRGASGGPGGGPAAPEVGRRGFTIDRTLGTGGTTVVWLARQHSLDRDVAVKAPLPGGNALDAANRVLQEAWVTGLLEHPGVVPVHDVALDDAGCPHIIMRRIEGWTWAELLDQPAAIQERFGVRDVLEWHLRVLMSVASTVHHAHLRGVIHRDLKPDNVMIGPGGEAYVLDWGIAAALDERAACRLPRATHVDQVVGTPRFMAPEMADLSLGPQGVHSDVYLLGGLLYAILTGDGPHPGDDVRVVLGRIPLFEPHFPDAAPGSLAALATRALASDPALRPTSAEEFRRVVQGFLDDRIAEARVRWCLDQGDAVAAEHALAEVGAPDPDLVLRVDDAVAEARRRVAEAARREEQARRLTADFDPTAGIRTRTFLSNVFGVATAVVPILWWFLEWPLPLSWLFVADMGVVLGCAALWWWARDSLGKSAINRTFIRITTLAPTFQMALIVAAAVTGLSVEQVLAFSQLVASGLCLALAVAVEPWLALAAIGFAGGFFGAILLPRFALPFFGLGNAGLMLMALIRWGPEAFGAWLALRRERARSGS